MNAAGAWQLPLVFVVTNNQWAISVPRAAQTAAQTLAQKAIAAGIPCEQVDGNDLIAVRHAMDQALERARDGGGPTLIEALTYRLSDHTTADDASRYRSADEVAEAWKREPIAADAHLSHGRRRVGQGARRRARQGMQRAACRPRCRSTPIRRRLPPSAMFEHSTRTFPPALEAQRAEVETRQRAARPTARPAAAPEQV